MTFLKTISGIGPTASRLSAAALVMLLSPAAIAHEGDHQHAGLMHDAAHAVDLDHAAMVIGLALLGVAIYQMTTRYRGS